jgi:uncharacterized protein
VRPDLGKVIHAIRAIRPRLEAEGVAHLSVFGSVARGDATSESDVDLIIEPAAGKSFSLFDLVGIDEVLRETLQRKVDVLTDCTVRGFRYSSTVLRESVAVF